MEIGLSGKSNRWCVRYVQENLKERTAASTSGGTGWRWGLGANIIQYQESVATAANVVRGAIVLVSVHEERANVGRSIQAENAEASSLLPFSTNLSDKEEWESQPGWYGTRNWSHECILWNTFILRQKLILNFKKYKLWL